MSKKWKAEIVVEDTPPEIEDCDYLSEESIMSALSYGLAALEKEWVGLKVVDFRLIFDRGEQQ